MAKKKPVRKEEEEEEEEEEEDDVDEEEKEEALRLKTLAEEKYKLSNLKSALKYAERAQRLHPNLDGISEMVTTFNILQVATKPSSDDSPTDWYKILQVEPFSHINSIKKQYKKLALILHPDKNTCIASEEAFKHVGEAFRVLSDRIRRREYDVKLRIALQSKASVSGGVGLGGVDSFWTKCSVCRLFHEFEVRYIGHRLMCPSCKKSFLAVEVPIDDEFGGKGGLRDKGGSSRAGASLRKSVSNESVGRSGNVIRKRKDSDSISDFLNRLGIRSPSKKFKDSREMTLAEMQLEAKRKADEEKMTLKDMVQRNEKVKGKGKLEKNSKSEDKEGKEKNIEKENAKVKGMGKEREQAKEKEKEKAKARDMGKEREQVKEKEKAKANDVGKQREHVKEKEKAKVKDMGKQMGQTKEKEKANAKEKAKTKLKENEEDRRATVVPGTSSNLEVMAVEDSDFYNFDKDRTERSFKKSQVWAVYDDDDGMPRHYGLIDEVLSVNPFEVRMSWLDLQNNADEGLISWEQSGFHVSCGRFKVARKTTVDSVNFFSHPVECERVAREIYRIYPKKGSIWALYNKTGLVGDDSDADKRSYDIVVFLTSYSEMHGLSMAYLEKVQGFKTIFQRREIGSHAIRWMEKDNIQSFSHQIPARRLSGTEAPGLPKDCWELDPASLPPNLLIMIGEDNELGTA